MNFVDIHSHLLPGIDDGAKSFKEAIKMLDMAIANGTTDIFATSHFRLFISTNTPDVTVPLFNELKEVASHLPINLYLGNEMRVEPKSIEAIKTGKFNTLNNSKYLLIDFPFSKKLHDPLGSILEITKVHEHIIIAHPERHDYIRKIELIKALKEHGILFQVNMASLMGEHGVESQQFAHTLLDHKLADFIASDAHNTYSRPPILTEAYQLVKNQYGLDYADELFKKNARKLLIDKE